MANGYPDISSILLNRMLNELLKDESNENKSEANTFLNLASNASSQEEFDNLNKMLPNYFKKNDSYGPEIEATEKRISSVFNNRKIEYNRFKEAHNDAINMTNSNYLVSGADKDGGIQNISVDDIAGWKHEKLAEELGKVNRLTDSFSLIQNGYKYNIQGSPHTTKSLLRDISNYKDILTAGLEIAIHTGEVPNDESMIRAIFSGRTDKVKEIAQEGQNAAKERYIKHVNNINSYDNLLNKISSYKEPSQQYNLNQFINSTLDDKDNSINAELMNNILNTYAEQGKMTLDYNDYATKINIALENEIDLRNQANKKHKEYTGKFYEEIDKDMGPAVTKMFEEGVSEEIIPTTEVEAGTTENRSVTNNNPGNLRFAKQINAIGQDDKGFAQFDTPEEGWDALYRQIELDKNRDLTLEEFINKYAPPSENDTISYIKNMEEFLNTKKDIKISSLNTEEIANAIARQEGYTGDYPKIKEDKSTIEQKDAIQQTDFDEKRHSINDPRPTLKKMKGKFVFEQDGKIKEWNNKVNIKGFDNPLPVLNAGYDKFIWHNGKWRHSSDIEGSVPMASKKEVKRTEAQRSIAFKEAAKDIKAMASNLGYDEIGDATKKTKGKPVQENVYKYSKSLWDKLPNETKKQFGSFNAFMEAVINASKTDIEFKME